MFYCLECMNRESSTVADFKIPIQALFMGCPLLVGRLSCSGMGKVRLEGTSLLLRLQSVVGHHALVVGSRLDFWESLLS
jgi:hypothetical protein